jgi:hypothetical protein
MKASVTNRSF